MYHEGDYISLDGSTGNVYGERIETEEPRITGNFAKLMNWADQYRQMGVRTNADIPRDSNKHLNLEQKVLDYVEQSICFLHQKEYAAIREMIVSKHVEQRKKH